MIVYVSFMVTTKQEPIVDTQRIKKRNLNIPLWKITKSQGKRAREEKRNFKTAKKQ